MMMEGEGVQNQAKVDYVICASSLILRFSSEGYVNFGKWILFPSNVMVERALVVPGKFWRFLSDRSYFAPKAFEETSLVFSITLPVTLSIMGLILVILTMFSFCHWLAYTRMAKKKSILVLG